MGITDMATELMRADAPRCREVSDILERLESLSWEGECDFPVPPQGVIEFARLAQDPEATTLDLAAVLEDEPRLTVEMLRVSNSSAYGLQQSVNSVVGAIGMLGAPTCSSILLTRALTSSLEFVESKLLPDADARRESLERAMFAKHLASRMRFDAALSYTAACLQDMMLPLLTQTYHDEYECYLRGADCSGIEEFERRTFGWTHAEVTAKILLRWGFPTSLVSRVFHHHAAPEELFVSNGRDRLAVPNATASLLNDVMRQAPRGVIRLVDLQRLIPEMELLEIALSVDKEMQTATDCGQLSLFNRIQLGMLEQVEQLRTNSIVPGRQFGNYVLEEKLTESSMGAIYKARHTMLQRLAAIKFLRADKITPENVRQFEQEVQLTSTLSHPNTISIFDYGRTGDDLFFYAMEYVDGLTLDQLVERDGPIVAGRVLSFLQQIAGSLAEAHWHGLVHRDIKPQNIMLSEGVAHQDRIIVLDFGLVTHVESSASENLRGTPSYMSPEAALCSNEIDERSDLYSVGAVAYFLLTGQPMFSGSLMEVLEHQANTVPDRPSDRTENSVPVSFEELLMQCLHKSPEERPASANELLARLEDCQVQPQWSSEDCTNWWNEYRSGSIPSKPGEQCSLDETLIEHSTE